MPHAQHVVFNAAVCPPKFAYVDAASLQYAPSSSADRVPGHLLTPPVTARFHLHAVQPDIYGLPCAHTGSVDSALPEGCASAQLGQRFYAFRGKHEEEPLVVDQPDLAAVVQAARAIPKLEDACQHFRSLISPSDAVAAEAGTSAGVAAAVPDAAVSFLGTGSMIPGKYRNVSGILLCTGTQSESPVPEWIALLDSGEGTAGSIMRKYGDNYHAAMRNLRLVFITHMHADHHLGLIRLLLERERLVGDEEEPLLVVGPAKLNEWLSQCVRPVGLPGPRLPSLLTPRLPTQVL